MISMIAQQTSSMRTKIMGKKPKDNKYGTSASSLSNLHAKNFSEFIDGQSLQTG